ncbi:MULTISPECIES: membrane protein insertion efficiency factor YidD [Flavobacterium]|uniref:Membrane protein insertion efficiency factor YidD n=1 Tax=Flavobacterium gyeonganense TaxID=1310418 RepID=A0ABV5H8M2_9FLAO|nr:MULTISPECIES: membrane protein insertion efficiency factor YidD [Flavobacterium]MBZ4043250.1 membrane protein insertion efficiency factor YidD [Flavobacterium hibisci]
MKYLILFVIQIYWKVIPASKRKKCIFKKSCSNYVFETTQKEGFISGLKAFRFRFQNCRAGCQVFKDPVNGKIQIILPSQIIVEKEEMSERLTH